MGNESLGDPRVNLVIFTCSGREHLLLSTLESFKKHVDFRFNQTILAIDGEINTAAVQIINPDVIVQQLSRSGYVKNILNALKQINTPYFFWLEDDWKFHKKLDLEGLVNSLKNNEDWVEIVLSKNGALNEEQKVNNLTNNLYETTFGFSANPCLCNTQHLQSAFNALEKSIKGNKLGEDGFENFLSKKFAEENKKCVILDPVDQLQISHEGYLESTPRSWHMTNSIENKAKTHLLTIPVPSLLRRFMMIGKLLVMFIKLSILQLRNNKVYEYCFRVIRSSNSALEDE